MSVRRPRQTAIPRTPDDSVKVVALDLAAQRTPAQTLELFSATRAAFLKLRDTLNEVGAGLFLCPWHHEIQIMPQNADKGYDRPVCPKCGQEMRYCLAEL